VRNIKSVDENIKEKAQAKLDDLTKPRGSLGRLEEISKRIVGITENMNAAFKRKVIFTMAGDHGVASEGVSLFPQEVTCQMIENFIKGGAGINVLSRHCGAEVVVVDMGTLKRVEGLRFKVKGFIDKKVGFGTKNMAKGPAMTREEAIKAIESGIEVFEEEFKKTRIDIVGTGDMGIANTTSSSAIVSVCTGAFCREVTGRGTGIDDKQWQLKVGVVEKALNINKPDSTDPLDILSKVGGFEIGGICGVVLAAASRRVPVVMDGFISTAATLLTYKFSPVVKDYVFAAHKSQEKGHGIALDYMGLRPLLDLEMRLGEGTGSALAMNIIEASMKIFAEMATFSQAGVSEESEK